MTARLAGAVRSAGLAMAGVFRRRDIQALLAVYAVSRVAYFAAGIRFDYPLRIYSSDQFMDAELLRTRLFETVFYMHAQPPLFNLLIGLGLKVSESHASDIFQAVWMALGLATYLSLYGVMRLLGVRMWIALVVSTVFVVSPAFILWENGFFYDYPVMALLVLSAYSLAKFITTHHRRWVFTFFLLLAAVLAMRSLFHAVYLLPLIALLLWFVPDRRRVVLAAGGIALALTLSVYVKNGLVFGEFSASTSTGPQLARQTLAYLPERERRALVEQGTFSEIALIKQFSGTGAYPPEYAPAGKLNDVPVLWNESRQRGGGNNFNHIIYVKVNGKYLEDSLWVVKHMPRVYLSAVYTSAFQWFRAGSDASFLWGPNRGHIQPIERFYSRVIEGRMKIKVFGIGTDSQNNLFLWVGLPGVVLAALAITARPSLLRSGSRGLARPITLFCAFTILYVFIVSIGLEPSELNRYRFMTDGLSALLLGVAIEALVVPGASWLRRRAKPLAPAKTASAGQG